MEMNMQNKEYEDILGSSPIYWSSTTIADQILGKFRKDLGLDPGEESQMPSTPSMRWDSSVLSRIVGARCLAVVQDVGSAPIPLRLAA